MQWAWNGDTTLQLDAEELSYPNTAAQADFFGKTYSPFQANALRVTVAETNL